MIASYRITNTIRYCALKKINEAGLNIDPNVYMYFKEETLVITAFIIIIKILCELTQKLDVISSDNKKDVTFGYVLECTLA